MVAKTNQGLIAAQQFVQAIQRSGINIRAAYLFGSYAKGTANADSDIDVALVSPDLSGWVDDLERMIPALLITDSRIESVRFRPQDFRDENPLVHEIKTTGISLVRNGKNSKRRATPPRNTRRPTKRK